MLGMSTLAEPTLSVHDDCCSAADAGQLAGQIGERNADVTFVQGLAGIAGLIAAQVEGEPKSTSMQVLSTELQEGSHSISLPAEVPSVASFLAVTIGLGRPYLHGRCDATERHAHGPQRQRIRRRLTPAEQPGPARQRGEHTQP
jgi:hypothetical protein